MFTFAFRISSSYSVYYVMSEVSFFDKIEQGLFKYPDCGSVSVIGCGERSDSLQDFNIDIFTYYMKMMM